MAEHMLLLGAESPDGREALHRRRVPERVRQDEFRHAHPAARASTGWKIRTIGDDIAWMQPGAGRPAVGGQPGERATSAWSRARTRRPTPTR